MLSHHDQTLLKTLASHSLLELVPFFKQTRTELLDTYLQRYHLVIAQLEHPTAQAVLTAFLVSLDSFCRGYLASAQSWDQAFLETMAERETNLHAILHDMLDMNPNGNAS